MVPKHLIGLPVSIVGPVDVGRLIRELETIESLVLQQSLQKTELKLPKTSKLLDDITSLNKLDLLQKPDRETCKEFLKAVKTNAPVLHISFSADPSPIFTNRLMAWLRENIHPLVLVTVGLQPNIGAGCIVRSTNKYFDFSLRQRFAEKRGMLMQKLVEAAA